MSTYKQNAAVLEAFRRQRFLYRQPEDTRSRYELFLRSTDLMEGQMARHMPSDSARFANSLECPAFPVVDTLQKHKAVAFNENTIVELVDPVTHEAVGSDVAPVVKHLGQILTHAGIIGAMARADSYLVTHRSAAIHIRTTTRGQVRVRTLPPYCVDVVEDDDDPGCVEFAPSITVPARGDAYPEDLEKDRRIVYGFENNRFYAGLVDHDGRQVDGEIPGVENGVLRVQKHPVVIWKEHECDTVFAPLPKHLMDAQVKINLLLAETQHAFRAGAHGQSYLKREAAANPFEDVGREVSQHITTALEDKETSIKVGQTSIIIDGSVASVPVIPPGWDLGLQQAKVDPIAYMKYVEAHIKLVYAAEDMVVSRMDLFNPQPHNISGAAKMIDASPLEETKQRRELRLAGLAEKTLELFRDYWNLVCRPEDKIPENYYFRVRFPGLWSPTLLTNQSHMQGLEVAFKTGAISMTDIVATMQHVSREEARKIVARNVGQNVWLNSLSSKPQD